MLGIACMNRRGGVGKTTLAHLLALGASWFDTPSHVMHTDDREPLSVSGRPYGYYDARDPKVLEVLTGNALNRDGLCIIDSGGNRPKFDQWIADAMDLILIPVDADEETIDLSLKHYDHLKECGARHVRYVINQYPSSKFEREYAEAEFFSRLPEELVLMKLKKVAATRRLRQSDRPEFKTPPTNVNSLSKTAFLEVRSFLRGIEEPERLIA